MRTRRVCGFTLIELLVVIAIIGVLTAMVFPVYAKARAKARQATCISNIRQITMAFLMYAGDCDGRLPPATGLSGSSGYWGDSSWLGFLQPYINNKQIYICPESPHGQTDWHQSADPLQQYGYPPSFRAVGPYYAGWVTSFDGTALWEGLGGFSSSGGSVGWYHRRVDSRTLSEVARPTDTIVLLDHWAWDWGFAWGTFWYPAARHTPEIGSDGIDLGFVDCAFLDGHVKALKHAEVWRVAEMDTRWGHEKVYVYFWPYN